VKIEANGFLLCKAIAVVSSITLTSGSRAYDGWRFFGIATANQFARGMVRSNLDNHRHIATAIKSRKLWIAQQFAPAQEGITAR
jgi:hypothetical protein